VSVSDNVALEVTHYKLMATLLLPFRSWLPASQLTGVGRFLNDEWDTQITLSHCRSFRVPFGPGQIDATLCTVADVSTCLAFNGDSEAAKTWARKHASAIIADIILARVNEFVLQVKRVYPKAILTGTMRNIGDVDLIYSYLLFEGETIYCRSSPAMSSCLGVPVPALLLEGTDPLPGPGLENAIPFRHLSREWIAITRAVDLVNHGYFEEALLVSFALLDALAQDFLKQNLPNLGKDEALDLVDRIESRRLTTFLGPLMRVCLGASPFDDHEYRKDVRWLNRKRNAIVHDGEHCSRTESQRGVSVVWRSLRYLGEKGANYSLPSTLEFWTPTQTAKIDHA